MKVPDEPEVVTPPNVFEAMLATDGGPQSNREERFIPHSFSIKIIPGVHVPGDVHNPLDWHVIVADPTIV